jgi:aquaporin Z
MARKMLAELLGTATLVYVACGVATMTLGPLRQPDGVARAGGGILITALAFGLVLAALAYAIGPISGCHVNPAVTVGAWAARRISSGTAFGYVIAQVIGGILGAGALDLTLSTSSLYLRARDGLGADGYGAYSMIHASAAGAFMAEVILTGLFVLVILAVTRSDGPTAVSGLIIGLTLAAVHLFGIPIDGTSVNPARSLGPALFVGGGHLSQVWLFLLAPLVGGILAAVVERTLRGARS